MMKNIRVMDIPGFGLAITQSEAARDMKITRQAVSCAVSNGKIKACKVGNLIFLLLVDVEAYKSNSLRQPGRKRKNQKKD